MEHAGGWPASTTDSTPCGRRGGTVGGRCTWSYRRIIPPGWGSTGRAWYVRTGHGRHTSHVSLSHLDQTLTYMVFNAQVSGYQQESTAKQILSVMLYNCISSYSVRVYIQYTSIYITAACIYTGLYSDRKVQRRREAQTCFCIYVRKACSPPITLGSYWSASSP